MILGDPAVEDIPGTEGQVEEARGAKGGGESPHFDRSNALSVNR
jgi:hypothetical protein